MFIERFLCSRHYAKYLVAGQGWSQAVWVWSWWEPLYKILLLPSHRVAVPINTLWSCTPHQKPYIFKDSDEVYTYSGTFRNSGNHFGNFITFIFQMDKMVHSMLAYPKWQPPNSLILWGLGSISGINGGVLSHH